MRRELSASDDAWRYLRAAAAASDDPRRYDGIELCDWERDIRWDDSDSDSERGDKGEPSGGGDGATCERPADQSDCRRERPPPPPPRRPFAKTSRGAISRDTSRPAIFECVAAADSELDDGRWIDAILWDDDDDDDDVRVRDARSFESHDGRRHRAHALASVPPPPPSPPPSSSFSGIGASRASDIWHGDDDGVRRRRSGTRDASLGLTAPPLLPTPNSAATVALARFDAALDMAAIVRGETDWRARLERERVQTPYNVSNDSFYERAPDHHRHPLMDAAAAAGVVVSDRIARVQKIVAVVRDLDYFSSLRAPGARSFPYRSRLAQLERFARPTIGGADDAVDDDDDEWGHDGDGGGSGGGNADGGSRKKPLAAKNRVARRRPVPPSSPPPSASSSDFSLSCARGVVILTEHLEQHPSLLQLPGMSTAIAHYWRPVSDAAPSRPRSAVGTAAAAAVESTKRVGVGSGATPLDAIRKRQSLADALERIARRPTAAIFPTVRLEPEDASPLVLGDLAPGTCTAVLENSLYRAPAHEHTSAHTQHSFLLVRTRVGAAAAAAVDGSSGGGGGRKKPTVAYRWRLNVVRGWFALGQQQPKPKREVPLPHEMVARNIFAHQKVARFVRARLEDGLPVDLQLLTAVFGRRSQPLLKTVLATGIRQHQERTRKRLERTSAETTTAATAPNSKSRLAGGASDGAADNDDDDRPEDDDEKEQKLTRLCAYESMLGAAYRLRHVLALGVLDLTGLARLVALFDRRTHAAELRVLSHIQRELQMAPWSQTRAFLAGTSRGGLTLQGRGNPLPNRAGFAFVIQTGITYNKGPRVSPAVPTASPGDAAATAAAAAAIAVARRKKRRRASTVSPPDGGVPPSPPPALGSSSTSVGGGAEKRAPSKPGKQRRALGGDDDGGDDDDDARLDREKSMTGALLSSSSSSPVVVAAAAASKRGDLRKLTMASMHAELKSFNVAENGYATTKRWDCVKLLKRLRQGNQLQERRDFGPEERPTAVRGTREYVAPAQYERLVRNILARQVQLIASTQPPRYPSLSSSSVSKRDGERAADDRKRNATSDRAGAGDGGVVVEHPWVDEVDRNLLAANDVLLFASRGGRLTIGAADGEPSSLSSSSSSSSSPDTRPSDLIELKRAPAGTSTGAPSEATRRKKIVRMPVVVRRHTYLDPTSQKVVSVVTHSRRTELVAALAAAIDAIRIAERAAPVAATTSNAFDQESASSVSSSSPELCAFYRAIDGDRGATDSDGGGGSFVPARGAYFFGDRPCAVSRVRPPSSSSSSTADGASEDFVATNDDGKSFDVGGGGGGGDVTAKKKSDKPRVAKRRNKLACLRSIKLFSGSGKPMFPLSAHDEREYRLQNRDILAAANAVVPATPTSGAKSGAANPNRGGRASEGSRAMTRKDGNRGGESGRKKTASSKTKTKKRRRRRRGSSESESDASEHEDSDAYLEGDGDSDDIEDGKTLADDDDDGDPEADEDDAEREWLPKKRARKSASTSTAAAAAAAAAVPPPTPPPATRSHSASASATARRKTARSVSETVAFPAAIVSVPAAGSSLRAATSHRVATRKRVRTVAAQSLSAAAMASPPLPPLPPLASTPIDGARTLAPRSAIRSKTRRK